MDDPAHILSEQQKACLRLVGRGMSSKEIAFETGLAPQTVDTYVKVAIARLGASNRRDAARMLAAVELSRKSGSPTPPVAVASPPLQPEPATERWAGGSAFFPPIGGVSNRLSSASRTYAALRIAAMSAGTVIAIALLLAGAFRALH